METGDGYRKVPNPPRTCIFCGGRPISKEHLYAEWMADFLWPGGESTHRVSLMESSDGERDFRALRSGKGSLPQKGDHRSKGLRVVCTACNNGWMSQMQSDAKPVLMPYLLGDAFVPNRDQQRRIANWSAMFSIVWEQADLLTAAIDQRQRTSFMRSRRPPKHWLSWIGRFDGTGAAPALHRGLGMVGHEDLQADTPYPMHAQITIGGAGGLLFVTASTTRDSVAADYFKELRSRAAAAGLLRVWPSVGFRQSIPSHFQHSNLFEFMNYLSGIEIPPPHGASNRATEGVDGSWIRATSGR